jgi:hypothetical protein
MTGHADLREDLMEEPTMEAVTRRLERLERDHRRWKRVAGWAVAGFALTVLLGAVPGKKAHIPDEVRAKRFVLIDTADRARAELAIIAENQPHLALFDDAGKPRLMLSLGRYGEPSLSLLDAAGHRRIALSLDLYGALLRFSDAAGHVRVVLAVPAEGEPEFELLGKDDKVRWRVP